MTIEFYFIGLIIGFSLGLVNANRYYYKIWNTLKAESGYRTTINMLGNKSCTIEDLMENIEKR